MVRHDIFIGIEFNVHSAFTRSCQFVDIKEPPAVKQSFYNIMLLPFDRVILILQGIPSKSKIKIYEVLTENNTFMEESFE